MKKTTIAKGILWTTALVIGTAIVIVSITNTEARIVFGYTTSIILTAIIITWALKNVRGDVR